MQLIARLALVLLTAVPEFLNAQGGSLTPPPGPIEPVMKTLDQIEARIPVNATTCPGNASMTYVISQRGSYYLTGDLVAEAGKAGIHIFAQGVTLDLNGFNVMGQSTSTHGIVVGSLGGPVVIRNGLLRFWPQGAIHFTQASDFTIEDIMIYSVQGSGINALGRGAIERVSIQYAKDHGIYCLGAGPLLIRDCRVEGITGTADIAGIHTSNAVISGCSVSDVSTSGLNAAGIQATGSTVANCNVRKISTSGNGRVSGIENASTVADCVVSEISATTVSTSEASGIYLCGAVSGCRILTISGGGHHAWGIANCSGADRCSVASVTGTNTRGGIKATRVAHSNVNSVAGGTGIVGRSVTHCHVYGCGTGINLEQEPLAGAGHASDNTIEECTAFGISASGRSAVITSNVVSGTSSSPGSIGISIPVVVGSFRIDGNMVTRWGTGISATGSNMVVVRNSVGLNTTNLDIHASMPVVTSTTLGTNPNANVTH